MRRRRRQKRIEMTVLAVVSLVIIVGAIIGVTVVLKNRGYIGKDKDTVETGNQVSSDKPGAGDDDKNSQEEAKAKQKQDTIAQADHLAATYDYDGAVALLKALEGYDKDTELQQKIQSYEATKAACKPVNMEEVTHVFYHSLVVDPERCFANQDKNPQAVGNNQWMTTVSEFQKITQEMYERGYVIVSVHDLYEETTDESGNTIYKPATILLPEGKKAYVLSQDDLCYYHSYDNYGFASKMIVGEDGKPTCEYIQADGTTVTGAYDVVPVLDQFIEEHPDASYRGAKGIIALTGYNGILGYRTDESYLDINGDINNDKKQWLKNHPEFDIEKERAEAKKVADAIKADGWEFASHTWGHMKIGDASIQRVKTDTQKFRNNVEPLVGPVDTIIFAHGQDLGNWGNYDESSEKYQYLREQGYNIFCNVDSNQYRLWFGKDYVRMGRRNLDGFRIYYNAIGEQNNVSDLFDAKEILDPLRPPVKPLS